MGRLQHQFGRHTWNSSRSDLNRALRPPAVIADAVTLLSNAWIDTQARPRRGRQRFAHMHKQPDCSRHDYYRLAIAGGKNIEFSTAHHGGAATRISAPTGACTTSCATWKTGDG